MPDSLTILGARFGALWRAQQSRAAGLALASAALLSHEALAQAPADRVTLRAGATYSYLGRPTDPAGAPTLLYGSAFAGAGFALGAALDYGVTQAWSAELGLSYALLSGTGYAEDRARGQRQTLTLRSHTLRVPLLARLRQPLGGLTLSAAAGPEIIYSVASSSTVTFEGIDVDPAPLQTADPLHIGLTGALGVVIPAGQLRLPVELRATFDPMVKGSTRGRLLDYSGDGDPGRYEVAFRWQTMLMIGVELEL